MGILGEIIGVLSCVSCSSCRARVRRLTDRQYLIMNNSLILFTSLYQGLAGAGVVLLFNKNLTDYNLGATEDRQAGTQSYMVQAILGGFLTVLSIIAIRAAIKVNIQMLIMYYWLTLIAIPLLFLFSVASLDFKELLEGWISHRWEINGFEFLRKFFCEEELGEDGVMVPTYDGKCMVRKSKRKHRRASEGKRLTTPWVGGLEEGRFDHTACVPCSHFMCAACVLVHTCIYLWQAPINGGPDYDTTDEWCISEYGSLNCYEIRRDAENEFKRWMSWLMNVNGIVGIVEILLLLMSLKLVERTLTLPVIMSSLLDAMNYLVFLPAALCILVGVYLSDHDELQVKDYWLKYMFFIGGGSMFLLSFVGIMAAKEKLRGVLMFYAFSMTCVVGLLAVACASSFIFSWKIRDLYGIEGDGKAGAVACKSGLYGCCCCDLENIDDENLCPEWTRNEIIHVVEADYKLAGLISAISCLFTLRASRACWILISNLKDYKCVYI